MHNRINELAAFVFPLPDTLKEQYEKWCNSLGKSQSENKDQTPVFIPVYPAYPGHMPYPPLENCCTNRTSPSWPLGLNPFLLFLIFLLLFIGFKKDQILAALRKLILKPE